MKRIGFTLILLYSFALFIFSPFNSFAEIKNIYDTSFEIESVKKIGEDATEIVVLGETRVLTNNNVDKFITDTYFKEAKRPANLSPVQLRDFVLSAFKEKDIDTAQKALSAVLQDTALPDETAYRFIDDLIGISSDAGQLFKNTIGSLTGQPVAQNIFLEMIYFLASIDQSWFEDNAVKWLVPIDSVAKNFYQKKFLSLLNPDKLIEAKNVLSMLKTSFGEKDPLYKKLDIIFSKLSEVPKNKNDDFSFRSLMQNQSEGLDPSIVHALIELIHSKAEGYLKDGKFKEALSLCAQVDQQLRTQTTYKIVETALKGLIPPIKRDDFSASVWDLLTESSSLSPSIKSSYVDLLYSQIQNLIMNQQFSEVDFWFSLLLKINPNPSALNDELKLSWSRGLINNGQPEDGLEKLHTISVASNPGLLFKKVLLLVSARRQRIFIFVALLVAVLTLAGAYFFKKKIAVEDKTSNLEDKPMFVKQGAAKESPESREFQECLAILGVPLDANEQEVKSTYRRLIKEVHPDKIGSDNPVAADRFMRLQKAYDRIERLNAEFGFLKKQP